MKDGRIYPNTPYGDLPSVTTILALMDNNKSGALMGWAVKVMAEYLETLADDEGNIIISRDKVKTIFREGKAQHKDIKDKAGDLGSQIHNLIEVYLKGQKVTGLLEAEPRLNPAFMAFKQWEKENELEVIKTEMTVCSPSLFAGTLDCIGKIRGKLYLIDFKTSTAIRQEMKFQVSAYKECIERGMYFDSAMEAWADSRYKIEGMGILRLGKFDGIPEWKEIPLEYDRLYLEGFKNLCSLWHILYELESKEPPKKHFKTIKSI